MASLDGNGTILFQRETSLWAQDFDVSHLQLKGEARLAAQHVGFTRALGFFAASKGTLVHRSGLTEWQLRWFDRHGRPLAKVGRPAELREIRDAVSAPVSRFDARSIWDGGKREVEQGRMRNVADEQKGEDWVLSLPEWEDLA